MPPLLGVYDFTLGLPLPPPTGVSACTAGLYAAVVGRLRLHRPAASSAADWCLRLHGWPIMPPLLGDYDLTLGLPPSPPTGVSACTAGLYAAVVGRLRLHPRLASAAADWCFCLHGWPLCRRCWASTSSPTGRLISRRLVFPPARLAFMPPLLGVYDFTTGLPPSPPTGVSAYTAWPIMPPLLSIYDFATGLSSPPPIGISAYRAGLLCRH
uniref:cysteine dioxygenase n=1 Tax=Oryza sativa subsp. japonica TaxID=39947 RepID=Q2R8H6_ORYSJ|nr:hypothetical protein LOC_Os11g12160 [Oryza sativa Japonica Group]